ncbi:MAG: TIGR04053 family radical SAM/SPASM domain-containing protein [Acidobacteriota bacterium]|nr:TIGR04053 family radical SAM/SPASM domain-containing protein [Acidobacteriota bacterium]MDE3162143.1 TIGR04053 family radical SAM/SPASM domain-containing protein [Acidobacteriota bacterium]
MHNIPARGGLNYDETPFLAIWEVTQSCDLACKHCRAAAQPIAHPEQLSTAEGKALIDQIAAMQIPIFVFTGGDPLKRPDLYELIRYSAEKGVKVAVTPSATPLLTREAIFKMKEAGIVRLGISLDGSTPEIHDTFRGLPGAWARTIQAIEWANEAGIPIQVHTTISRHNADDLDNLCALFEKQKIVMWNVFFLVPVGRGQLDDLLSGEEFEQVFGKIYELSHRVSFQIKSTEAMHYRRYLLQHNLEERKMGHGHGHPHGAAQEYEPGAPTTDGKTRAMGWATRRVNDGKGFMFISHVGNVYPSGFLPIHAGNVRETPLAEIYREAPIFKALRDTSKLEGKCGACEFKEICGGSRARAYALTGDPLAQEPCCIYQPKNWDPELEQQASAFKHAAQAEPLVTL